MLVRLELSSVQIFCTQFAVLYRWIIYQCGEYSLFCVLDLSFDLILEQESIPVGCEPLACQPYVLHNKQVRSKCLRGMGSGWGGGGGESPYIDVPCLRGGKWLEQGSLYSEVHIRGSLYGEVQCIMEPPPMNRMTKRHG